MTLTEQRALIEAKLAGKLYVRGELTGGWVLAQGDTPIMPDKEYFALSMDDDAKRKGRDLLWCDVALDSMGKTFEWVVTHGSHHDAQYFPHGWTPYVGNLGLLGFARSKSTRELQFEWPKVQVKRMANGGEQIEVVWPKYACYARRTDE